MTTVRVIGAGMNGLLAAYYLVEKGVHVEIYEKSEDVGGKIQTTTSSHGLMEAAANAILADAEVEAVARTIGVELIPAGAQAKRRWIYKCGKLKRWPLGFMSTLKVAAFLFTRKSPGHKPLTGERLSTWGERILGREATHYVLSPACLGIFGVPPTELSATLIFNYFFTPRKREAGALRGSVSPKQGMGEFPQKLKSYLQNKGVPFHFKSECEENSDVHTIVATDLASAAALLKKWGDKRGERLAGLPFVDLVSVNAFFRLKKPLKAGFGILFPRAENVTPLGVLFNSFIFDRQEQAHSETWIYGGRSPQVLTKESDEDLLADLKRQRKVVLSREETLIESRINRWPQAIPLYGLELEAVLQDLPTSQDQIHLLGNYLGEIGLNRFFHRARELANRISRELPLK